MLPAWPHGACDTSVVPVSRAIVAANALMETYQHLKDTGLLNITAQRVAELRRRVEELISLPEYYEVEAATTEKGSTAPGGHP